MRRFAAIATTFASLILPAQAETITYDPGGQIGGYIERAKTSDQIEIRGECYSGCTLLLSAQRVCVTHKAVLYFHLPWEKDGGNQIVRYDLRDWIMALYPPPVQVLIEIHGGLGPDFISIEGAELIRRAGYRDCDEFELPVPAKLWFEGNILTN